MPRLIPGLAKMNKLAAFDRRPDCCISKAPRLGAKLQEAGNQKAHEQAGESFKLKFTKATASHLVRKQGLPGQSRKRQKVSRYR